MRSLVSEQTPFQQAVQAAEDDGRVLAHLLCGGRKGKQRCGRSFGVYVDNGEGERVFIVRSSRPTCHHHIEFLAGSIDIDELDAVADVARDTRKPGVYWLRVLPGAAIDVLDAQRQAQLVGRMGEMTEHPFDDISDALPWNKNAPGSQGQPDQKP
jgi:hypothetical protein